MMAWDPEAQGETDTNMDSYIQKFHLLFAKPNSQKKFLDFIQAQKK